MSIESPDRAHDPAQSGSENDGDAGEPDSDELVVVVCPHRVYEQLRPAMDECRERLCRRYEREYEDVLADREQLADEVAALERQLRRKESQLDAVVTRNEQILAARTESYRRRLDGDEDDFEWTGRRRESGLLARLRHWFR